MDRAREKERGTYMHMHRLKHGGLIPLKKKKKKKRKKERKERKRMKKKRKRKTTKVGLQWPWHQQSCLLARCTVPLCQLLGI